MADDHDIRWSPIDSGGPIDPLVDPQPIDEIDRPAAYTLMARGWWPPIDLATQSYGFCFTAGGQVVLVQTNDCYWNLPGGGERLNEAFAQAGRGVGASCSEAHRHGLAPERCQRYGSVVA
jgi:hypothetical protein